jgi:hypothetical protein
MLTANAKGIYFSYSVVVETFVPSELKTLSLKYSSKHFYPLDKILCIIK